VSLVVRPLTGSELQAAMNDLAQLRIQVFEAYPYLYEGDAEYEAGYLSEFMTAPDALLVAAIDGGRIVGAATASPTRANTAKLPQQLAEFGIDTATSFYFGESVLLPEFRGQGIGNTFFDCREAHAMACGAKASHFAAVIRPEDHPARPSDYSPLEPFWRRRGYAPLTGLISDLEWKEHGEAAESPKPMQHWARSL
jgi:GNAT superfamily N-acetyltransferase